jgi:hypothetical protein
VRALEARGVAWHVAQKLASETPDLVGAWSEYAAAHPRMGPGAVIVGIRSGHRPPRRADQPDFSQYNRALRR